MKKWNQSKNMFVLHQWSPAARCHIFSVGGTLDEAINERPRIGPYQRVHLLKLRDTYSHEQLHALVESRERAGKFVQLPA